jgi:hypothetical protein
MRAEMRPHDANVFVGEHRFAERAGVQIGRVAAVQRVDAHALARLHDVGDHDSPAVKHGEVGVLARPRAELADDCAQLRLDRPRARVRVAQAGNLGTQPIRAGPLVAGHVTVGRKRVHHVIGARDVQPEFGGKKLDGNRGLVLGEVVEHAQRAADGSQQLRHFSI